MSKDQKVINDNSTIIKDYMVDKLNEMHESIGIETRYSHDDNIVLSLIPIVLQGIKDFLREYRYNTVGIIFELPVLGFISSASVDETGDVKFNLFSNNIDYTEYENYYKLSEEERYKSYAPKKVLCICNEYNVYSSKSNKMEYLYKYIRNAFVNNGLYLWNNNSLVIIITSFIMMALRDAIKANNISEFTIEMDERFKSKFKSYNIKCDDSGNLTCEICVE